MSEFSDHTEREFLEPSPEGRKHLREQELLSGVDWQVSATLHADAWHETGDPEELNLLLGAAAMAVQRIAEVRQIRALNRQLRL